MKDNSRRLTKMAHRLVIQIPEELEDGILYVSMQFGTVVHRCACGCGEEVVTPLGPAEWQLSYDGRSISLAPSIGNWSFPCRSHYWIESGKVCWTRGFSMNEISQVRTKARNRRQNFYLDGTVEPLDQEANEVATEESFSDKKNGIWHRALSKFQDWFWK